MWTDRRSLRPGADGGRHVEHVRQQVLGDDPVGRVPVVPGVVSERDSRLRRWVFGSTTDRVVDRARRAGVPVLVYASSQNLPERLDDSLFTVYRYLRGKLRRPGVPGRDGAHGM